MTVLYHITAACEYARQRPSGVWRTPNLDSHGFIHCSTSEQVVGVANRYFKSGQGAAQDLVLLMFDSDLVRAEIKYEVDESINQAYPHVYGPIDLRALVGVIALTPEPDGSYKMPIE